MKTLSAIPLKYLAILLLVVCTQTTIAQTSYPVSLRVTVIPPVTPYFDQFLSGANGTHLVVFVAGGSPTGGQLRVKIIGRLERLSPSPFAISVIATFQPQQPIFLNLGSPVTLNSFQLEQAFGNLADNNLALQSIGLSELKTGTGLKLPEGTYRICFTAYNYDPAAGSQPISDPNIGCGVFTICYKAAAPQFVQPVNGISLDNSLAVVNPAYPLIFSWTVPNSTCGAALPPLTYDLEIHELLNGQTQTDAINNPPIFMKQGLPSATFPLDTMLYKNVLTTGKKYVIRVHANTARALTNAISFDNNGYSRPEAFQYGNTGLVSNKPLPPNNPDTTKNNPPDSTKNSTDTTKNIVSVGTDSSADCGIKPPADSTSIDASTNLTGATLTIGSFKLTATTIKRNSDTTYSGTGTIDWKPVAATIKLAVSFGNIRINKNKEVYKGLVTSSTNAQKFSDSSFSSWKNLSQQTGNQLDQLSSGVENFINSNKATQIVSQITGNTPVNFPIGLDKQSMGGTPVTIAIMNMSFSPKGAVMSILFDINIPEANGWLSLAGTNFCVNPTGVSFSQGTLMLPSDRYFNFGNGGDSLVIKFKGSPTADSSKGTYVSWAGDSLTAVVAHAEIRFPKNSIEAEDSSGNVLDSAVTAGMLFRFHKWDDWIAGIYMPKFQINGVKGLSFQPDTIYYDHSTKINPDGFNLPKDYTGDSSTLFEGLYIKDMKVWLPPDFKTFNQGKTRTAFGAKDFVIDDKGVSAHVYGTKLIDLSTGDLGGWSYSLDTIEVIVQQNTFKGGSLNGKILLPISKTPLTYSGDMHLSNDSLQYEFVVKPSDTMKIDIWQAYVQLNPNSAFDVKKDSLGASISFVMSGVIGISLSNGSPGMNFPGVKFDSMGIANRNPSTHKKEFWFSPGTWAFASPQKTVSGFPVSINNLQPLLDFNDPSDIKLGVKFNLNINLGLGDASVISATTNLGIYGKIDASMDNMAPQIKLSAGIDVDTIKIKGDVGPVSVDGTLVFYKHDNTFGDGVKGHVSASFPMVKVEATAQFGFVNNFNYWFIDACANFPTIPVVGPIGINGFGGGAYYNMTMKTDPPPDPANLKASYASNDVTPGHSMSGVTFVPQSGSAGIRASICIAMVSGAGADAMNAKVTLTAQITNGSFDMLNIHGDVFVMTDYPSNDNAIVQGTVDITYDFGQNKFSLNADIKGNFASIKVDVPIGIYAGPDGWYFKLGDAFGQRVTFKLLDIDNDVFSAHVGATAYFEMGSLINPQLPDLPTEITSAGLERDPNDVALIDAINKTPGEGLMFGARVDGSLKFSLAFLYAQAKAILGFDLALKHFDSAFVCNSQPAGWQNWYALGQLYAYLYIDVGIHVDVWFYTGDLSLCKMEVAALVDGGLPNPTWLEGNVHVQGEVLNGLISVNTSAHFSIGDKCYPTPDPLKDIQIISDYGPKGKGDVFDLPYVASNVGLGTNYDIDVPATDKHPDGETRTYRFDIKSVKLSQHGQDEITHTEYQNNNTTAVFKHDHILKPFTAYSVEVVCNAMEFYPDENRWDFPFNDKDQAREQVEQTTSFSFTTGAAPSYIPASNVNFYYPVNMQRYLLKQELGGKGSLRLDEWQDNILPDNGSSTTSQRSYLLYFIDKDSKDTVKTNFTADANSKTLNYNLPASLKNNATYQLQFWSLPKATNMTSLALSKVSMSTRTVSNVQVNTRQTTVTSVAKLAIAPDPIYTIWFHTSKYNTFSDKLTALGNWSANRNGDNLFIKNDATIPEFFDQYEIKGFAAPDGSTYPSMFSARIEWDQNYQNDKFADDNLYANAFTLAFKLLHTDFGSAGVREQLYKPVNTLDWSSFHADAPLSVTETLGAAAAVQKTSIVLGGGSSNTNTSTTTSRSGYSMITPLASKSSSSLSTVSSIMTPYQFKWSRDYYIHQDYNMMNALGLVAQTQAAILQHQLDPQEQESTLSEMSGDITFVQDNVGGMVTMPWNKFYYLYTDTKSMSIINGLRNMKFTAYPTGSRIISFRYRAGWMQSNIAVKSFTYK